MLKKLRQQVKGFTIIEVLIVLAIAGLIMLIVFLAVPALQRTSRNTQRKNDVASILGAISEWSNNNSGRMPTTTADQTAALGNSRLGIYNGVATWGTAAPTTADAVVIAVNHKCNGATTTPQNRAVAVLYQVETGGGTQAQCESS